MTALTRKQWRSSCNKADTFKWMKDDDGESGLTEGCETQIGDRVRFAAADVFLPGPGGVLTPVSDVSQLDGTVIEFSDSGSRLRAFAVIEVVSKQMMVVPVEKLERLVSRPALRPLKEEPEQ
ncbi:conserved hypothetical protein [Candidatus Sulfopaludibacter sp. SbA3]|nr:conserved hypothetical protein [Candidatus Sulfopaludibacter sp. SbA3]